MFLKCSFNILVWGRLGTWLLVVLIWYCCTAPEERESPVGDPAVEFGYIITDHLVAADVNEEDDKC